MVVGSHVVYVYGDGSKHLGVITKINSDETCDVFVYDMSVVLTGVNVSPDVEKSFSVTNL